MDNGYWVLLSEKTEQKHIWNGERLTSWTQRMKKEDSICYLDKNVFCNIFLFLYGAHLINQHLKFCHFPKWPQWNWTHKTSTATECFQRTAAWVVFFPPLTPGCGVFSISDILLENQTKNRPSGSHLVELRSSPTSRSEGCVCLRRQRGSSRGKGRMNYLTIPAETLPSPAAESRLKNATKKSSLS